MADSGRDDYTADLGRRCIEASKCPLYVDSKYSGRWPGYRSNLCDCYYENLGSRMNSWWAGLILYMLLGGLLGGAGVGVLDKPYQFIAIMLVVVMIEFNGRH